jgi:HEAT repeat protein
MIFVKLELFILGLMDEYQRLAYLQGLFKRHQGKAVPVFLALLNDDSNMVRRQCFQFLAEIGTDEAIETVIQHLNDKFISQNLVINALQKNPHLTQELVSKYVNHSDEGVRAYVARLLLQFPNETTLQELRQLLDDSSNLVRSAAVQCLGELKNSDAVPELIAVLHDENDTIRRIAAQALSMIDDKRAVPDLITLLSDKNDDVRYEAITTLGMMQDHQAVIALLELLETETDNRSRASIVIALGESGDEKSVPKLLEILLSSREDTLVRDNAASSLALLGEKGLEALHTAEESGDDIAKHGAVTFLQWAEKNKDYLSH